MAVPTSIRFPVAPGAASFGTFWTLAGPIYSLFVALYRADQLAWHRPGSANRAPADRATPGRELWRKPTAQPGPPGRSGRARMAPWTPPQAAQKQRALDAGYGSTASIRVLKSW